MDSAPVAGSAKVALKGVLGTVATALVAHVVTEPMELPEIVAGVPAMAWIAPNAIPEPAPTIGIAIGTPVSDIVPGDVLPGDVLPGDVMLGDVVRIAGALRVDLTCANVELLPNKTSAAAMRAKLRIGTSCV